MNVFDCTEVVFLSNLFILCDRISVHYYFMDLYFVQRSIVSVNWLSLHQIQSLESVNYLNNIRFTLPKTVYCLLSLDILL